MMGILSFFSFDFLGFECLFKDADQYLSVFAWSTAPMLIAVFLCFVHIARQVATGGTSASSLSNQLLLLGYLVLPPVSLKQFQALDCVTVAERCYLRIDTSIDCDSDQFKAFVLVDVIFIAVYLSIPLVWLVLLSKYRERLNPAPVTGSDQRHALFLRDNDEELRHLRFLFASYKPSFFFAECIEM